MPSRSRWIGIGVAAGIACALAPLMEQSALPGGALFKAQAPRPDLQGLDLLRLDVRPSRVEAPLAGGRIAELTLDPLVQRTATKLMRRHSIPEGGVVMLDTETGRVLAYASHVNRGPKFDVNLRAEAPAASVFKVITAAALVERAGLHSETEQCYHGGRSRIDADELQDNPRLDKSCASLAAAMGRSLNVVFGRLAQKHLTPEGLTEVGRAFGFGTPVPFVAANQASAMRIPEDPLMFARTAAGFWNTTLSPLAGAALAQTVANGGVTLEPRIVRAVHRGSERLWRDERPPIIVRRAVKPSTAAQLTRMMAYTVSSGSARKSFHDERGRPYLPGISVAGKTGTLTKHGSSRHYTWFVGFAPAGKPEVAVSTLVVNTPTWQIKAPELARDVLRTYFAGKRAPGVTRP